MGEEAVLADAGRACEVAAGVGGVRSVAFLSLLRSLLYCDCPLNVSLALQGQRNLFCIAQVTITGQGEIRFSPLIRTFEIPSFLDVNRLESQAVDPSIDQVSEPRSRVLNQLGIGWALRRLPVVAPAGDPIPLSGGISFVEPNLKDWSGRAGFLEARENARLTILI